MRRFAIFNGMPSRVKLRVPGMLPWKASSEFINLLRKNAAVSLHTIYTVKKILYLHPSNTEEHVIRVLGKHVDFPREKQLFPNPTNHSIDSEFKHILRKNGAVSAYTIHSRKYYTFTLQTRRTYGQGAGKICGFSCGE